MNSETERALLIDAVATHQPTKRPTMEQIQMRLASLSKTLDQKHLQNAPEWRQCQAMVIN